MTTRQDLRDTYPFHNPRASVRCCIRRPAPRAPLFVRIMRALLEIRA